MASAQQWVGQPSIAGSTEFVKMALLTCSMIGLQFTWAIEMTYCTPYLLHLGLSKSSVSLVWIAGPLSGLIMQPVIGIIADKSTHPWGRRRPFMVYGSVVVAAWLLTLGWAREIVGFWVKDEGLRKSITVSLAVFTIYAIDFSINVVQATCRALVVDTLPREKQQTGAAWAARMIAVGNLGGYAAGAVDLGAIFGTMLGDTEIKQLCAIAAIALCFAQGLTSWAVTEKVLVKSADDNEKADAGSVIKTVADIFTTMFRTVSHLPSRISAICMIQFWSWIGWFPFLFYSSTWVGETYLRYEAPKSSFFKTANEEDILAKVGHVGSASMFAMACMTFASSVILPWLVRAPTVDEDKSPSTQLTGLAKLKPSLLTTWMLACLTFAGTMLFAPTARSVAAASFLVALCGAPAAVASWAPLTLIGVEINRLSEGTLPKSKDGKGSSGSSTSSRQGGQAGVYLGILNLYTTIPQICGLTISWIVFSILEPGKGLFDSEDAAKTVKKKDAREKPNGIAVCLFIGALCQLLAVRATRRLAKLN